MKNYLDLLNDILTNGVVKKNRTGINTMSLMGKTCRFDLSTFPLLTTRKMSLKIAFEETLFFLRGQTQTKLLEQKNVNIWKGNTSKSFLKSRGLSHLEEGDMGKGYGYQIRNFGGTGYDQLVHLLDGLKYNPTDRRHVISHWCPNQLNDTVLPPCHLLHTYSITDGKLDSSFIMRSTDAYLGLPTNIASYALMNCIFSKYLDLDPGELVYFGHDVHIYENHKTVVELQLSREPCPLPTLTINKSLDTIEDILNLEFNDLILSNYVCHTALPRVQMAV